jgi:hypothetical protein
MTRLDKDARLQASTPVRSLALAGRAPHAGHRTRDSGDLFARLRVDRDIERLRFYCPSSPLQVSVCLIRTADTVQYSNLALELA